MPHSDVTEFAYHVNSGTLVIVCSSPIKLLWLSAEQLYCNMCAEVKITYAENAAMSTQLYEVDVFMFFLKDLEAVSTNFYSDLWQNTRMHTPKV